MSIVSGHLLLLIGFCGVPLLASTMLMIDAQTTLSSEAIQIKKIRRMIFANLMQCLFYIMDYDLDHHGFLGNRSLAMLIETMLYLSNLTYIFAYADLIQSKYGRKLRHVGRWAFLSPVLIMYVLEIVNYYHPIFFDYHPVTLEYMEMPLVHLINVVPMVYFLFTVVCDLREGFNNMQYYYLPLSVYFAMINIGIVLESVFLDVPCMPACCALSLMILYVRFLKRAGYIDNLSGLYNRSHIEMYIDTLLRKLGPPPKPAMLVGVMLDVDMFKLINDIFGHAAGDEAIRATGKIIKAATLTNGRCFRFGGDEFIILMNIKKKNEIDKLFTRITDGAWGFNQDNQQSFQLSFSMGYAIYDPKVDTPITFLERMDAEMYQVKRTKKNNRANREAARRLEGEKQESQIAGATAG